MEETKYIRFEKYINNELSSVELKSFEEKLQTDSDFKQEFEIYKALNTSLSSKFKNEKEEKELRNTLSSLASKHIHKEAPAKKETKIISLKRYRTLMVAASIALLIGFFVFDNGNPVYSDFANHNSLELVVRSENNEAIIKAEKAFNSKNYKEALQQLTILSNNYLNDTEIQLYKGISLLELGNYKEAEIIFDKISNGNSSFVNTAIWYKALSLLKQKKYIESKQVLKTIPKSAAVFEQAQKLLKKL